MRPYCRGFEKRRGLNKRKLKRNLVGLTISDIEDIAVRNYDIFDDIDRVELENIFFAIPQKEKRKCLINWHNENVCKKTTIVDSVFRAVDILKRYSLVSKII